MERKRTLLFPIVDFQEINLGKDVFLTPYYLGKKHNLEVRIVYPLSENNKHLPAEYRGVKLIPLPFKSNYSSFSFKGEWYFLYYILRHAREADVLMRFHFSVQTGLIGLIYKMLNPNGVFYIKGDGYGLFTSLFRKENSLLMKAKNFLIRKAMHFNCGLADLISVETPSLFDYLHAELPARMNDKVVLMLNGFDEEYCRELQIKRRSLPEKENIMLAVGRIGAPDKNNEQLLYALEKTDLKDWKVVFVGPVENRTHDFRQTIDEFYKQNPHLTEKVLFPGAVYDKKELWEWYNRAKVFVHTSPKESFGIVLSEAFYFDNYILSTPVGIASYLINFGYGELVNHNDVEGLASKLQEVIDGKTDLEERLSSRTMDNDAFTLKKEIDKLGNLFPKTAK